jgi:hypothetical protein
MDKKIEQLCQSDIVNTNNILHIIDTIDFEIIERHFKAAFYGELLGKEYSLNFSDELDRLVHTLKEKAADSFQALLLVQGKDKDDEKELISLVEKLVIARHISLMNEGYITYLVNNETKLKTLDSKTLRFIYGLVHTLQHEENRDDVEKSMKQLTEGMAKVSKDLFGGNIPIDMSKLFEGNTSGKIDLAKILGTETKENVDIVKNKDD